MNATKRCTSCKEYKPLSEFHRQTQNASGYRPRCKSCRSAQAAAGYDPDYHTAYYLKNREIIRHRNRVYREINHEKLRAHQKVWREANKEVLKDKVLRRQYGISLEQWQELFESQGKACLICRSSEPKNIKGWHTDHGVTVRGILCHHCNTGLGAFNHDIGRLKAAIRYLAK